MKCRPQTTKNPVLIREKREGGKVDIAFRGKKNDGQGAQNCSTKLQEGMPPGQNRRRKHSKSEGGEKEKRRIKLQLPRKEEERYKKRKKKTEDREEVSLLGWTTPFWKRNKTIISRVAFG